MNILYVKRAYNTRLHTQARALSERGHSIILLLEAAPELGYSGPAQWDTREIHSRYPVIYASSGTARPGLAHRWRWLRRLTAPGSPGASPDGRDSSGRWTGSWRNTGWISSFRAMTPCRARTVGPGSSWTGSGGRFRSSMTFRTSCRTVTSGTDPSRNASARSTRRRTG